MGQLTALAFPLTVLVLVSVLLSAPPSDEAVDRGLLGAALGSSSMSSMDTGAADALAEAPFLVFAGLAGRFALAFSIIAIIWSFDAGWSKHKIVLREYRLYNQ